MRKKLTEKKVVAVSHILLRILEVKVKKNKLVANPRKGRGRNSENPN